MSLFNADVDREVRRLGGQLRNGNPYAPTESNYGRSQNPNNYGVDPSRRGLNQRPSWLRNNPVSERNEGVSGRGPRGPDRDYYSAGRGEPVERRRAADMSASDLSRGGVTQVSTNAAQRPTWLTNSPDRGDALPTRMPGGHERCYYSPGRREPNEARNNPPRLERSSLGDGGRAGYRRSADDYASGYQPTIAASNGGYYSPSRRPEQQQRNYREPPMSPSR